MLMGLRVSLESLTQDNARLLPSCAARCRLSRVQLFVTPWTVALQAALSTGLSRQEYWSGLHALLQGIFPIQGSSLRVLGLLNWQVGSL